LLSTLAGILTPGRLVENETNERARLLIMLSAWLYFALWVEAGRHHVCLVQNMENILILGFYLARPRFLGYEVE
jgi:hypothetical protein